MQNLQKFSVEVYNERKDYLQQAITKLAQSFGIEMVNTLANGNCLLNAFCLHQRLSQENASIIRNELVDFMIKDKNATLEMMNYDYEKYRENGVWLDEPHVHALHKKYQINIITLEYEELTNSFRVNRGKYREEFANTKPLYMLRTKYPEHFTYISNPGTLLKEACKSKFSCRYI